MLLFGSLLIIVLCLLFHCYRDSADAWSCLKGVQCFKLFGCVFDSVWLCVVCVTVLGDVWFVSIRCSIAHRIIDVLLTLFL